MASIDISSDSDTDKALKSQNSQKRLRTINSESKVSRSSSEPPSEEEIYSTESEKDRTEIFIETISFVKSEDYAIIPQKAETRFLEFHIMAPFSFSIDPKKRFEVDLMFSLDYDPIITTYVFQVANHLPLFYDKQISISNLVFTASFLKDWIVVLTNESDELQYIERGQIIGNLYLLNITVDRRVRLKFREKSKAPL